MASATPDDGNRNRRFVNEAGIRIALGKRLGSPGGQGTVYEVVGDPDSAVKIWHADTIPDKADAKIAYMVKNPVAPGIGVQWKTAWPKQAVKENGKTVGYTMPLLDPGQSWAETINYYNPQQARRTEEDQQRQLNIQNRARMAQNLALAFHAIHDAGYVIGDVNEKNATVNELNDVGILDCDSFGFIDANTGDKFVDRGGRDEFQAPETNGKYENRTQNQDCFGLAVLVFQFLTGFHPYTVAGKQAPNQPLDRIRGGWFPPARRGVEPNEIYQKRWDGLHDSQKELFLRCFGPSRSGRSRPTPAEWVEALAVAPQEWAEPARGNPEASTVQTPQSPSAQTHQAPTQQQTRRSPTQRQTQQSPTQQRTSPPRLNRPPSQRPRRQQNPTPQQAPSPQQTQPTPQPQPTPQTQPDPQPTASRPFGRRAQLLAGVIGLFVVVPLLFWLFSGGNDDETFAPVANVAAGDVRVPAAAPAPTSTPRPTVQPTNTAIPLPTLAPTNTPPLAPTPPPLPTNTPAPPTATAAPTNTPAPPPPTATLAPTSTPFPVSTRTPTQWLIQHPAHPKIVNSRAETQVLLQGCYLGNQTAARRFRLAAWDVWDPSRYGNELKFVRIIVNSGARLPLEHGACYEATVVKQVDSTEEYVCLDHDSTHSKQNDCSNYREHEVIPTFILYPDDPGDPNNYSESFVTIRTPGQ